MVLPRHVNVNQLQDILLAIVDGMGTESGHIIATTIGGRNGQPKQVYLYCVHSENSLGHNQESK